MLRFNINKVTKIKSLIILLFVIAAIACSTTTSYTFNKDIAPIIYKNCTPCHRIGGAAPFALTNFREVNRKRNTILNVTQSGYMPPWPADRNYSHFLDEKYLTEEEKAKLKNWIKGGAPQGEGSAPSLPIFSEYSFIGQPDTTVWFDSIWIEGDSRDNFFIATLPIELPEQKFIRSIEFLPN